MLTVFVLPGDNSANADFARLMGSFLDWDINPEFLLMVDRELSGVNKAVQTEYYMYLYLNEYLEPELAEALPVFLNSKLFDFLAIYQKRMVEGKPIFTVAPRIFRNTVELAKGKLVPHDSSMLQGERILNGYILGD